MTKLDDLKRELFLKRPAVRSEYDALAEEFSMIETLIRARTEAHMTQAEVATKMQTSQSYVAKLEGGVVNPSMKALHRYAAATGTRLMIKLEHVAPAE